ncbi:hypothetical protein sos41_06520 [Alphaproteobacteria bacterium SO-S41]|nr:hypothetical protein sos41_06520 [Alphaproteobacteria bacterium SO-S41]
MRDAAAELRCTVNTASKAFAELERLRLIECKRKGSFSQKHRHSSIWHLHWLPANGQTWEGFGPNASPFMRLPLEATQPREKNASRSQSFRPMVSKHETEA